MRMMRRSRKGNGTPDFAVIAKEAVYMSVHQGQRAKGAGKASVRAARRQGSPLFPFSPVLCTLSLCIRAAALSLSRALRGCQDLLPGVRALWYITPGGGDD